MKTFTMLHMISKITIQATLRQFLQPPATECCVL